MTRFGYRVVNPVTDQSPSVPSTHGKWVNRGISNFFVFFEIKQVISTNGHTTELELNIGFQSFLSDGNFR